MQSVRARSAFDLITPKQGPPTTRPSEVSTLTALLLTSPVPVSRREAPGCCLLRLPLLGGLRSVA